MANRRQWGWKPQAQVSETRFARIGNMRVSETAAYRKRDRIGNRMAHIGNRRHTYQKLLSSASETGAYQKPPRVGNQPQSETRFDISDTDVKAHVSETQFARIENWRVSNCAGFPRVPVSDTRQFPMRSGFRRVPDSGFRSGPVPARDGFRYAPVSDARWFPMRSRFWFPIAPGARSHWFPIRAGF